MAISYCEHCKKEVNARRKIGIGTLILVLLTAFLWIVIIPFYQKRCPICDIPITKSFRLQKWKEWARSQPIQMDFIEGGKADRQVNGHTMERKIDAVLAGIS